MDTNRIYKGSMDFNDDAVLYIHYHSGGNALNIVKIVENMLPVEMNPLNQIAIVTCVNEQLPVLQ